MPGTPPGQPMSMSCPPPPWSPSDAESNLYLDMDANDTRRLEDYFDRGFELQVVDLVRSDEADVRMGAFIQAAALIDALACAYAAKPRPKGVANDGKAIWKRFVDAHFPVEYAPVAAAYKGFRCLLLHNFSASDLLGFTHGEPHRHLQNEDGRVILDRGSFVPAIEAAFKSFRGDVLGDDELGLRVLAHLDEFPPVGFFVPKATVATLGGTRLGAPAMTAASLANSSSIALLSHAASDASGGDDLIRSVDRPTARPKKAASIKRKPKPKWRPAS